jgi:hypothetical protein
MKNLIRNTIGEIGTSVRGGISGAKEIAQTAMSEVKARKMEGDVVNKMVGPEGVFGRVNMEKQKAALEKMQKPGGGGGVAMRAYMADQYKRAGLKKVGGTYQKI